MKKLEISNLEKIQGGLWAELACGVGVGAVIAGTYGAASLEAVLIYAGCLSLLE